MSETDPEPAPRDGALLDLAPALRRKKAAQCKHRDALVSFEEASLVCEACGADLDPWTYIRMLAGEREATIRQWEKTQAEHAKFHAEQDVWLAAANARRQSIVDDINALIATKNKLWNERAPDGATPIGMFVRRRRKRKATAP